MEKAQGMIREIKRIKEESNITYDKIMRQMEDDDPTSSVSLSTLRRICREGSEYKASSFNFEEILMPVYNSVKRLDKQPRQTTPRDEEIEGYRAVIRLQDEELDRLVEIKEHLEENAVFMASQITEKDSLIKRLIDRLDQKDEIIHQFITDMKQKDLIVKRLMEEAHEST